MNTYERLHHADSFQVREPRSHLWLPIIYIWLLALVSFSMPERADTSSMASMDAIALAKLAIRISGLALFSLAILRVWNTHRRRMVMWSLWPLCLYIGWAIVTAIWSPLRSFSLGQAGSLLLQVMLAGVLAMRCLEIRETSTILFHLTLVLLVFDIMVLAVHLAAPEACGLQREIMVDIGGFVHPTFVGAAASLGMVILVTARLLWDWRWIRVLLAPGLILSGTLLYLSQSRTALGFGVITLLISFALLSRRIILVGVSFLVCTLAIFYLAADPGLNLAEKAVSATGGRIRRGQSMEEMTSFTGRTGLWKVIWGEFMDSPLTGQGYMVSSKEGAIGIWGGLTNKTAHNVFLQILVSTGLVGAVLCLWAFIRLAGIWLRNYAIDPAFRKLAVFGGIIGIWFFGWGMLCTSWFGPIRPESVVFYTVLGLLISRVPVNPPRGI